LVIESTIADGEGAVLRQEGAQEGAVDAGGGQAPRRLHPGQRPRQLAPIPQARRSAFLYQIHRPSYGEIYWLFLCLFKVLYPKKMNFMMHIRSGMVCLDFGLQLYMFCMHGCSALRVTSGSANNLIKQAFFGTPKFPLSPISIHGIDFDV
jgi:hypothetical protein